MFKLIFMSVYPVESPLWYFIAPVKVKADSSYR